MTILLLVAVLLQQDETIPHRSKTPYLEGVSQCKDAVKLLPSSPEEAIEILTRIIDNPKIKKKECRIRIEIRPGTYKKKYEFFPYRFRGLARMNLAGKTGDPKKARDLYLEAQEDFKVSVESGVSASRADLEEAEEKASVLKKEPGPEPVEPRIDPEIAFRKTWRTFLEEGAFRNAENHVENEGTFLSAEENAKYRMDTKNACRNALQKSATSFLENLEWLSQTGDLSKITGATFDKDFALPERSNLVLVTPAYEWCETTATLLREQRKKTDRFSRLLEAALSALSLGTKGRWFAAMERLCFKIMEGRIRPLAQKAQGAPAVERKQLHDSAAELVRQWETFEKRSAKERPQEVPYRKFESLMKGFPSDYAGFGTIEEGLRKAMTSVNPDRQLSEMENSLRRIRDRELNLSRESQSKILRYRIVIRGLRRFFVGKSLELTARELDPLGKELKKLGGSFQQARFGPKIEKLFEALSAAQE